MALRSELTGAMIGAGYFAQFQAEAWQRVKGARLCAVADLDAERGRSFADAHAIPTPYTDAERMLTEERPDFVDIVTRPETHLELTRLAAAHGAHAICQKPMAPDIGECQAMVEACEAADVRLVMHENWRWQPWYRQIRHLIDDGAIGRPYHVGFTMRSGDGRGAEPYTRQPYFHNMPRLLVYETLIHYLDTFRFLAGEIEAVACDLARINPAIVGEDYALIQLTFDTGVRGMIDANRITGPIPPPVTFGHGLVEGEAGAIHLAPDGRLTVAPHDAGPREHAYDIPEHGYKGDSVFAVQQHIVDALRDDTPCESEGRDYLKTMAATFACYDAAAQRRVVTLGP